MTVFVSMPYIGLLPFLLEMVDDDTQDNAVCQCPTSGFSHFYAVQTPKKSTVTPVSMPYIGLLPFLLQQPRK